jgi:hypothetical protein
MIRNEELYTYSPHAVMAFIRTTLYDRLTVVSVIHFVADYWVDV